MNKGTKIKAISMLLVGIMLMANMVAFASFPMDESDAGDKETIRYVSLGDSMTNGYGLTGFYQNEKDAHGFLVSVEGTYPSLLKDYLEGRNYEVDSSQLAIASMRSLDLRFLLDDDFEGDAITKDLFIPNVLNYVVDRLPEGYTKDISGLKEFYQDSIADADLITYSFYNDFIMPAFYAMQALEDGKKPAFDYTVFYDPDFSALYNQELIDFFESVRTFVADKLYEMLAEYDIEKDQASEVLEYVGIVSNVVAYSVVSYCNSFDRNMQSIFTSNPNAKVIVIDSYNPLYDVKMSIAGAEIDIGALLGDVLEICNGYAAYISPWGGMLTYHVNIDWPADSISDAFEPELGFGGYSVSIPRYNEEVGAELLQEIGQVIEGEIQATLDDDYNSDGKVDKSDYEELEAALLIALVDQDQDAKNAVIHSIYGGHSSVLPEGLVEKYKDMLDNAPYDKYIDPESYKLYDDLNNGGKLTLFLNAVAESRTVSVDYLLSAENGIGAAVTDAQEKIRKAVTMLASDTSELSLNMDGSLAIEDGTDKMEISGSELGIFRLVLFVVNESIHTSASGHEYVYSLVENQLEVRGVLEKRSGWPAFLDNETIENTQDLLEKYTEYREQHEEELGENGSALFMMIHDAIKDLDTNWTTKVDNNVNSLLADLKSKIDLIVSDWETIKAAYEAGGPLPEKYTEIADIIDTIGQCGFDEGILDGLKELQTIWSDKVTDVNALLAKIHEIVSYINTNWAGISSGELLKAEYEELIDDIKTIVNGVKFAEDIGSIQTKLSSLITEMDGLTKEQMAERITAIIDEIGTKMGDALKDDSSVLAERLKSVQTALENSLKELAEAEDGASFAESKLSVQLRLIVRIVWTDLMDQYKALISGTIESVHDALEYVDEQLKEAEGENHDELLTYLSSELKEAEGILKNYYTDMNLAETIADLNDMLQTFIENIDQLDDGDLEKFVDVSCEYVKEIYGSLEDGLSDENKAKFQTCLDTADELSNNPNLTKEMVKERLEAIAPILEEYSWENLTETLSEIPAKVENYIKGEGVTALTDLSKELDGYAATIAGLKENQEFLTAVRTLSDDAIAMADANLDDMDALIDCFVNDENELRTYAEINEMLTSYLGADKVDHIAKIRADLAALKAVLTDEQGDSVLEPLTYAIEKIDAELAKNAESKGYLLNNSYVRLIPSMISFYDTPEDLVGMILAMSSGKVDEFVNGMEDVLEHPFVPDSMKTPLTSILNCGKYLQSEIEDLKNGGELDLAALHDGLIDAMDLPELVDSAKSMYDSVKQFYDENKDYLEKEDQEKIESVLAELKDFYDKEIKEKSEEELKERFSELVAKSRDALVADISSGLKKSISSGIEELDAAKEYVDGEKFTADTVSYLEESSAAITSISETVNTVAEAIKEINWDSAIEIDFSELLKSYSKEDIESLIDGWITALTDSLKGNDGATSKWMAEAIKETWESVRPQIVTLSQYDKTKITVDIGKALEKMKAESDIFVKIPAVIRMIEPAIPLIEENGINQYVIVLIQTSEVKLSEGIHKMTESLSGLDIEDLYNSLKLYIEKCAGEAETSYNDLLKKSIEAYEEYYPFTVMISRILEPLATEEDQEAREAYADNLAATVMPVLGNVLSNYMTEEEAEEFTEKVQDYYDQNKETVIEALVSLYGYLTKAMDNVEDLMDKVKGQVQYTIEWNVEGKKQTSFCGYDKTPSYPGKTPSKNADGSYTYTFEGWTTVKGSSTVEALGPITHDMTYYAVFSAHEIYVPEPPEVPVEETTVNADGSVTKTVKDGNTTTETTKNQDGSTVQKVSSTVKGVTTEKTVSKDASGKVVGVEEKTITRNGIELTGNYEKVENIVTKDADGNVLSEATVTTTMTTVNDVATKIVENTTVSDGITTTESTKTVSSPLNTAEIVKTTVVNADGTASTSLDTLRIVSNDGSVTLSSVDGGRTVSVESSVGALTPEVVSALAEQMALADEATGGIDTGSNTLTVSSDELSVSSDGIQVLAGLFDSLTFEGGDATVSMPTSVLSGLVGEGETLRLTADAAGEDDLNDAQKEAVGGLYALSLELTSGDRPLHELNGVVTIAFEYQPTEDQQGKELKAFYVDENGVKTPVESAFSNGVMYMTLEHMSVYVVDYIHEEEKPVPQTSDNTLLYVAIAVIVIIAAAGVVVFVAKGKH